MQKKKIIILTVTIIAILVLLILSINVIRKQDKSKLNLSENVARGTTVVEPNVPVLSAGMIPIKLDGEQWIITTQNDKNWYNYLNGQPAYMMLNDGYYKSELERGIEENQLASNNVGVGVPDDPQIRGTIFVWIPRFATNEEENIQYIRDVGNAEVGWTIPELFAYRQESETMPDFLLTGVWVEKNVDNQYANKIAQMNQEESIYGFIKNTIAVANDQTNQTAIQTYIVGNDAHVVPFNDISNPNRIILKIINQNYQDPIKAKGSYSKDTGLIEIQVTYSQYGIEKVLYEDTQELKLTRNNNKATATSEGLNIKYGTALITVIDNRGNSKEVKLAITSKVFVKLYTDGTLGFSSDSTKIAGKDIIEDYGDISNKEYKTDNRPLWYLSNKDNIKTVEFANEIAPISTAWWFFGCINLEKINNIENLNTTNVTNMSYMFGNCYNLQELNVSNFDTSNVTIMTDLFSSCRSLTNLDLSNFDTSKVTDLKYMFSSCRSLTNLDLSNFDTSKVTDLKYMFNGCENLTELDLSSFDTSKVTDLRYMFDGCSNLSKITFGEKWNKQVTLPTLARPYTGWYSDKEFTNKVAEAGTNYTPKESITIYADVAPSIYVKLYTDGTLAFCSNNSEMPKKDIIKEYGDIAEIELELQLSVWWNEREDITTVEFIDKIEPLTTYKWFFGCINLEKINNIENLNTKNVMTMYAMFEGCTSLTTINLSNFDTSNVTIMTDLFSRCRSLTNLDLSNFDTSKVTDLKYMFNGCENLTELDLSSFDTSKVTDMRSMFNGCSNLKTIYVGANWKLASNRVDMFTGCGTSKTTLKR